MKKFPFKSIFAPLAGLSVCIIIIICCGQKPMESILLLFTGTFSSKYYFGLMLNTASMLMISGCGALIALKGGSMNLGGEGQIYAGGLIAGLVLSANWNVPPFIQFLIALILCITAGAFITGFSAVLKELRGTEVLLTSFLLSAAIIPLADGLITSINGKTSQNLIALPYIRDCFKFHRILSPSPLTAVIFPAILICIFTYFIYAKTYIGRKSIIWGKAPLFAKYSGYSSTTNTMTTLCISGALHSLTGFFAVAGTYYTCHQGFYLGMGWNALSTALIASGSPLSLIPSALVLSWIYTSAGRVGLTQGFDFDISGIVQSCILFSIAIPFVSGRKKK